MDSSMNHFIFNQLHVAQQSRREKLRVQHCSPSRSDHHVEVVQPGFNPILSQPGDDMRNSAGFFSTFCSNSQNEGMEDQASIAVNSINLASSNVDSSLKPRIKNSLENCGVWKSVIANSNADHWNTDCIGSCRKNDSQGIGSDIAAFELRAKQNFTGYHQSQFQYGDMNLASKLHYQNANSDGVTTAAVGLQPINRWGRYSEDNEHVHLAPYGYQSDTGWNAEMSLLRSRTNQVVVDSQSQGLSLSLCSYPAGSMISGTHFGNSHIPQPIPLHNVSSIAVQDTKPCISNFVRTSGLGQGNPLQVSVEPSTNYHRQTSPLGPFTGYSTILKGSRFLGPAQQLLDEYCGVIEKHTYASTRAEASGSDIGEFGDLAAAVNSIVSGAAIAGDIMGVSAATQQDSEDILKGASSSPKESLRPDYQAKKVKLLYMLEEVCRKYKHYYQQMQMVVSSFESVAGLAGATPYIASALKSVSGHFNHLKNAITDQLRHIKTFLGDDFSFQSGIRDKADFNNKRLKYTDHSFQKHTSGGSNMGLLEPQQHIWRPQRGLPECAVSVLRAWLFEHFLHPYPADTDKHMLATLTGLTRNQVSNWFINARVRLWKPMVEEVHMLETKGTAERNRNSAEDKKVSTYGDEIQLKADHSLNKMVGCSVARVNLECPATGSLYEMGDVCVAKQYDQEKQSRVETHNMSSIDEGILDSSRLHHTEHEVSGLGSISLTLGLRQSAEQLYKLEGSQHLSYLQQQGRPRQHLGGHAMHEYTAHPDLMASDE